MKINRLPSNPIIFPDMPGLEGALGNNINGPSLIRTPSWINNPLGKYYLYFAHHKGTFIRLATANNVEGPYQIVPHGVLRNSETFVGNAHIASPDVHILEEEKKIGMYFHSNIKGTGIYQDQNQTSYYADSPDGINFTAYPTLLAPFYVRTFEHDGAIYGLAKNDNESGILLRSQDGKSLFERGPTFIKNFRHCALLKRENIMYVFFTRVGDKPESILLSQIRLNSDWRSWTLSQPELVLNPEMVWEGSKMWAYKSEHGSTKPTKALRDPCIFEENGKTYLLYAVKGEYGIAIAELEGI
jgi:hypothetical protein